MNIFGDNVIMNIFGYFDKFFAHKLLYFESKSPIFGPVLSQKMC
jgi:hypothetical protein